MSKNELRPLSGNDSESKTDDTPGADFTFLHTDDLITCVDINLMSGTRR